MGAFAAGQVVLLPFPFSDLTGSKLRPALLLASVDRGDWIACQITSNPYADPRAIELENHAFASGGLQRISYIRPSKLFTANESLIVVSRGSLKAPMLTRVRDTIVVLIRGAPKVAARR
jgi:mRNA interferase MazF